MKNSPWTIIDYKIDTIILLPFNLKYFFLTFIVYMITLRLPTATTKII